MGRVGRNHNRASGSISLLKEAYPRAHGRIVSRCFLNTSSEGDSITSLGNLLLSHTFLHSNYTEDWGIQTLCSSSLDAHGIKSRVSRFAFRWNWIKLRSRGFLHWSAKGTTKLIWSEHTRIPRYFCRPALHAGQQYVVHLQESGFIRNLKNWW